MSVIQKIQQRQKWVFGAIALALILFIVQDRLMGKGSGFGPSSTIGKINGETIDNADFRNEQELYKQPGTDEDVLASQVWQNMVSTTVMNQEIAKLGLSYTPKEFGDDIASNNPPTWFRNTFTDQQTGAYNAQQATSYISQVSQQLRKNPGNPQAQQFQLAVLDPAALEGTSKKYESLIAGAVYIPKWMADKTAADNSSITNMSYVNVPYSNIPDSTINVSDDEVNAFVKKHPNQFEQKEETRQIAYVVFDASPSAQDTLNVENDLTSFKNEFRDAKDVKSFLEEKGSTLPYYDGFISKSQIHQPVNDSLFKLQPGQLYGPYKDGGSYVVAKMVDEKVLPDSAEVRHILVMTHQQDQQSGQFQRIREDSTARKRLDSAIAELKSGASFDSVCKKYSDDGSKNTGGVIPMFATSPQMAPEFSDFSFTGKVGETKVVQTVFGYHYIEILKQKGSEPAYKIAYLGKAVTVSQETDAAAENAAARFAGSVHTLKEFYDEAAKLKKTPFTAAGIKENDYTINNNPGMQSNFGKNRQFIKWVYSSDIGDISPQPVRFTQKYIVAIVTGDNKPGLPNAQTARPLIEAKLKNDKKAKIIMDTKIKGNTLEAVAQANNTTVAQADSVAFQAQYIPNIGQELAVLGAAFNKQLEGKVSPPIQGQSGVYVIKSSGIAGVAPAQGGVNEQRTAAENALKAQEQSYMQYLIKAADVKDYRSKFY
ncbi:MAG TPA: peptidylprolyl isomerase [Chitinophagaceae bacterium]|nr:peptidylprolyl isomerase [Chitinophagaceae bacterium]